jgi:hypothetical protein
MPYKTEIQEQPEVKQEEVKSPGVSTNTVQIQKDNMIVIDETTGESIPPISSPGVSLTPKVLEPKYDYDEPYSFREKGK